MSKNLVIVESPAKAKTISRFLGKDYKVLASFGHVRDLPKSKMGIDIKNNFEPTYLVSVDKKKVITELKGELKKAEHLYIATDQDREGEAIGWHLLQALSVNEKKMDVKRIAFHEITESAIKASLKEPHHIDMNVVDAQQARRVLDRLVGYELSPLLWKKIRFGLSAGRVQSVAVRLVVEREREINAFKPEEYWKMIGEFEKNDNKLKKEEKSFSAELMKYKGENIKVSSEKESNKILKDLEGAEYKISAIEEKQVKKSPSAPFITSTLQQEASRKLGFSVKKTMMIAQQLYEGVDIGTGETGLITYMRTDSVNLAEMALTQAKQVITKQFGAKFALSEPRKYKGRKNAQEAHEAIRPVDLSVLPENVEKYLDKDQFRLYELVWKRTLACQMADAALNRVAVDITPEVAKKSLEYMFRATGQTVVFAGFMQVYTESKDLGEEEEGNDADKFLPKLSEGEFVDLQKLDSTQHFTKPPARYTEASLVKKLESEGIGRPSTYAPTISTIISRGYVVKEAKVLVPTDVAMVVTDLLVDNFSEIIDYKFTAQMEENLDEIEEGKRKWVPVIREFYEPFHANLKDKEKTLVKKDIVNEATDEICDLCGEKMVIKLGRFGKFLSCSNYPKCKNAKPLDKKNEGSEEIKENVKESEELNALRAKFKDKKCDKCDGKMDVKIGRYGPFLGCSNYPKCKNITAITVFSGVKCPKCKSGQLVERRTKKGARVFYGCNKFPKCRFATWDKPLENTPDGSGIIVENKNGEKFIVDSEGKKQGV
ncbi:MAG: type I DNA topoisomerase [Candidatus Gracilibacteria bacterium]|jgi:DNA topoisomerase-1